MSSQQPRGTIAPPSALPDVVKTKSFVPPRPPVLNPDVGQLSSSGGNPFALKYTPQEPIVPSLSQPAPPPVAPAIPFQPAPTAPAISFQPAQSSAIPIAPPSFVEQSLASSERPSHESPKIIHPIEQRPKDPISAHASAVPPVPPTSIPTESTVDTKDSQKTDPVENRGPMAEDRIDMTGGLMGWLTKTMTESKLLSDVAEKAKHGMEQVLTTLDPGMRGFLSDDLTVELNLVSCDANIVRAVKEGFERVFANVLVMPIPAATISFPPLVSGSAYSLEMCRKRAKKVLDSKLVETSSPLLVMQPFIMQIDNRTYAATRLFLQWKEHSMDSISQLLPVEENIIKYLEKRAKDDGKTLPDFSLSLSRAVRETTTTTESESWAGPTPPYSFSELLVSAAASVALQFMNATQQDNQTSTTQ